MQLTKKIIQTFNLKIMKKHLLKFLLTFIIALSVGWVNGQTPIITAIADCDASGGTPKVLEIYAHGTIDFTLYSLENQSNDGTTWGNTTDLSSLGTVTDDFVYIYNEGTNTGVFLTEFPAATGKGSLSASVINLNGDDRIRIILTATSAVIDQYGVTDVDGTGETWETLDSYAKRNNGTGPDAGFTEANWTIAAYKALDGEGLDQSGTSFEIAMGGIGTYTATAGDNPPQATFLPANGASNVLIGSDITITFDEAIYTSGAVEVVDADLPALITLKETDASGADIAFTATYSNTDPFVITIDPTSDLTNGTDYYVAFGSVYDDAAQENTGGNATFTTELGYIPMVSAYAISNDAIEVTYESSMTVVDPADFNLTGTAAITFTSATIDGTDDKIVHLSGASATITGDGTLDNIADANSNVDLYAGITPIQYTNLTNPGGTISNDINATFHGIVSANDAYNGVWVADAEGAYNGILVYNSSFDALVAVGDEITFTATLTSYSNLSELVSPSLIGSVTSGQTPYGPSVINGSEIEETIAADTDPGESWEGQLIKIVNAEITLDIDANYSYTATDDASTTTFKIGDNVDFRLYNISLTVGDDVTITGVGDYEDGTYRINPRSLADILSATDTVGSTVYTVDQGGLTITDIPFSATLDAFEANIEAADTATFDTYLADGTTLATTDVQTGYKVIVTAADGITKATYTITKNAALTDATVTSTEYTVVEGTPGTISNVSNGTDLATFKGNITAPQYGSFEVYVSDGGAVATDLADGYFLTGTAEDGVTTEDYTIEVSSVVPDTDSEVVAPTTQVAAATIAVVDGDTEGEAFGVFSFDINDAGTADGLPTNISQIVLFYGPNMTLDLNTDDIADGWFMIDGSKITFTGEPIIGGDSIAFTFAEGEITVPDGSSVNAILELVLDPNAVEGNVIQLMIDADQHGFETIGISSEFSTTLTGGDIVGNDITIDVVATELNFSVEPTNVYIDAMITPAVIVKAVDANGNIDTDYTSDITITATGATLVGAQTEAAVAGLATFDAISFSDASTGVTLTATDGVITDATSATFDVTEAPAADLFFSEYIESGNEKAFEIYNPTGSTIDLSNYTVKQSHNGTGWGVDGVEYVLPLTGSLNAGDVYVVAGSDAADNIKAEADLILTYGDGQGNKVVFYSGNDAMGIFKADVLIDVIGIELTADGAGPWAVGDTTNATDENTLIRKTGRIIGNTNWAESAGTSNENSEWIVREAKYSNDIGNYGLKTGNDILSFDFVGLTTGAADIDDVNHTVDIEVKLGTPATALTATFTLSEGASAKVGATDQVSGTTENDFSSPVTYTVTAEDASYQDWTVTVTVATTQSPNKDVTSLTVAGIVGDAVIGDGTITATVEYGTNITSLKPTFTISDLASISDTTVAKDFTTPQTYIVTAEDASTKNWVVTITAETVNEVTDIASLRALYSETNTGIYKLTGEVTFTYATSPNFYIQDGTAAILIYNGNNAITTAYNIGDNVQNLIGTFSAFNGNMQFVLKEDPGAAISSGNTITAQAVTITELVSNYADYDAELIKLEDVTMTETGTFESGTNYTLNNGSDQIALRTNFSTADYIGTAIPEETLDITALAGAYKGTPQVYPRSLSDFVVVTGISDNLALNSVKLYPNPSNGLVTLELNNVNNEELFVEVYDVIGKLIYKTNITENRTDIDLTQMNAGIYYVSVNNNSSKKVSKIMIQ